MVETSFGLSRRGFGRRCAAAVAGLTVGTNIAARGDAAPAAAPATRPATSAAGAFPRGRFVDVHTHVGRVWNTKAAMSVAQLLEWMDANDVAQAVVLPLVNPEASSFPIPTDYVLEQTAAHRDRLIPFCCVDPRTSYDLGFRGLVDMLKRFADAGAKGFGEHKPGVAIDDERSMALYAACGKLNLPVLFHLDAQRNTDAPGLPGLERVLRERPGTTFIGHGPGWWASIGGATTAEQLGGYPKGDVAPGGAIDRLMDRYPNLYGDLSAGSGAGAIGRDPTFGRAFLVRRADRLLFGTDYLSPGQNVPQLKLLSEMDLPADVQAKVFRDNARRLLGLGA